MAKILSKKGSRESGVGKGKHGKEDLGVHKVAEY